MKILLDTHILIWIYKMTKGFLLKLEMFSQIPKQNFFTAVQVFGKHK